MTDSLIALTSVVVLLLGSPGPAPLALAAVGASFGIRRGLPFLLGILIGLLAAIIGAIVGLSTLFALHPVATIVVQFAGGGYILYVAFKIASAPVINNQSTDQNVPSFIDGFILNLLNPKAYAAFFAIFSQFLLPLETQILSFIYTAVVCMLIATLVDSIWLILGGFISPIFKKPLQARLLRITFGLLMVIAVAWTIFKTL